jgi:hypothetical protein
VSAVELKAPGAGEPRTAFFSLRRGLAMLLLPAAIVPVPFLGPALLRSPGHLARETEAAVERLEAPAVHQEWLVTPAPSDVPDLSPAMRRGVGPSKRHRITR